MTVSGDFTEADGRRRIAAESAAFSPHHRHFRLFLAMLVSAWAIISLAHVKSFSVEHVEGDELVYLSLSRQMNWDLSHYTTMDDPTIRLYPSALYRQPLFIHPPLYPLILKIGGMLGNRIATGLLFANLSMGLLLLYTWRAMVLFRVQPSSAVAAFLGIAFCPLLLFSTARLHHDALFGIWLTCGMIAYLEALNTRSVGRALLAGGLITFAMNLRYTGIVAPLLVALGQGYFLYILTRLEAPTSARGMSILRSVAARRRNWIVFGVVIFMVLSLGMQHYYRLFATYQTLRPYAIMVADPDIAGFSPFLQIVMNRSRSQTLIYLVAIFPILLIFITPWPYRVAVGATREGHWAPMFMLISFCMLILAAFPSHPMMRYYAAGMPALYLYLPLVLERSDPRMKALFIGLGIVTLWMMVTTGFYSTNLGYQAAAILPSAYNYFPFLE